MACDVVNIEEHPDSIDNEAMDLIVDQIIGRVTHECNQMVYKRA